MAKAVSLGMVAAEGEGVFDLFSPQCGTRGCFAIDDGLGCLDVGVWRCSPATFWKWGLGKVKRGETGDEAEKERLGICKRCKEWMQMRRER